MAQLNQNTEVSFQKNKNELSSWKVLIIIPAFNEGLNIQRTIQEILQLALPVEIIVINDGSKDDTAQKARELGVAVVSLPYNLGIGGAVQTGYRYAKKNNFDIAIQVDGDAQHDVTYLKALLRPIFNGEADMTIGSRFIPPFTGYQSSFVRRIGIHFFANLISLISKCRITDPTSGFRAVNKHLINIFAEYYPDDFPEPEAIMVAARHRSRVLEVPVQMRKREYGNSSIRYLKTLYYMIKVTFAVVLDKLKKHA
ncbi:MAG: glycosyltransferase family 2 protein [Candidatus Omnitrophica bacterium]|nr:glycosyltransferase family 2 protein [Candidatus Omnitrophota bacterium]